MNQRGFFVWLAAVLFGAIIFTGIWLYAADTRPVMQCPSDALPCSMRDFLAEAIDFTNPWVIMVALIVIFSIVIGFFVSREVIPRKFKKGK